MDKAKIARGVGLILDGIGADRTNRNYKDTPRRVAKMYHELFTPTRKRITSFPETHDSMIVLRGHTAYAVCPHHLLPVELTVYIGYIPQDRVLGLSKLARIAEAVLTEPIMQETYTDRVCDALNDATDARGASVIVTGTHGCMRARGVHTRADVVTSARRGIFLTNPSTQEEFMRIIGHV